MSSFQWALDEGKFLSKQEIQRIRRLCEKRKERALLTNEKTAVKEWFLVELVLETGLRVNEIAKLKCGDVFVQHDENSVLVREGKNKKPRVVKIRNRCKMIILEFLAWKKQTGEVLSDESPLIYSPHARGHISCRALQKMFKRCARRAGVLGHSIHHCRHTYASAVLQAGKSTPETLVFLKNQLGHSSIKVTEQYLHIAGRRGNKILERLYE